jgi:hypothetical protein
MVDLWSAVAPTRQFAPVLEVESLHHWVTTAPGLAVNDYLLARDGRGRLLGFVGMWDQRTVKSLRVLRYSSALSLVRRLTTVVAPLVGAIAPPATGQPLHHASAVHLCVPAHRVDVLRALVLGAYDRLHGTDRVFMSVAIDAREPFATAFRGLLAAPTAIDVYATMASGTWTGPSLEDRPVHFETTLI